MILPKRHRFTGQRMAAAVGMMLISGVALAHPGHHDATGHMLLTGLLHPLTGTDHLLAMLAVGLWAATGAMSRRAALGMPLSFLALLFLGAMAGMAIADIPAIEPMIIASLLILGLLLVGRIKASPWAGPVLVATFALFHGIAHGVELAPGGSAAGYVAGFMLSTLALLLTGLGAGWLLRGRAVWLTRLAGAGIAAYGLALWSVAA
ncbi:HupE/UreJ family protein [Pollutimonas sp. M17]|jgi:urease accessory protein|uniref:HupE/UreJ family protein n=1 Tax=Pollutimonas sp. M17 TaxID=2962065 RepID=UPI0021F4AC6F|nr:HupE/UreJ family protein [Pollutimonas sp. M17]UYO93579.1 HupE/UreJ family protein [Pollutimonas sp. M17]